MPAARTSRNNVLAGLFLLISVALAVVVTIVLSNLGDKFAAKSKYIVRFSVADGAEGLDKGAPVKVGGKRVGQVVSTDFVYNKGTGEPEAIEVTIEMPRAIRIYGDADVQLLRPLLGSLSSLNISTVSNQDFGDPARIGPPRLLEEGETIRGRLGAPGFIAQSDYAKFQDVLARVDHITADIEPRVAPIMDDAKASAANFRAVTDDVKERWGKWGEQVDAVVNRVEKGSEQFEPIAKNFGVTVEDARAFVARVRAAVDENRGKFDEIVESVRDLTKRAQGEGYDKFIAALDAGKQGLDSFNSAAKRADELLATKGPEVGEMVTAGLLAAQQLKLATVEIRSSPWRLLYQPTKKELENELLYNSVRQYSAAVTELRGASDALNALAARNAAMPGASPVDPATLERLTAKLKQAFDQYQEQERAFLERWVKSSK